MNQNRQVTVAAIQMRCAAAVEENLRKAEAMVRQAASMGAQIILLPELFEREYFCQQRRYDFYAFALPVEEDPAVQMGIRQSRALITGPRQTSSQSLMMCWQLCQHGKGAATNGTG